MGEAVVIVAIIFFSIVLVAMDDIKEMVTTRTESKVQIAEAQARAEEAKLERARLEAPHRPS